MHSFHRLIIILILLLIPSVNAYSAQFAGVSDKKAADLAEVVQER